MIGLFATIKAVALGAYFVLGLLALRSQAERRVKAAFVAYVVGIMLWNLTALVVTLVTTSYAALWWYNVQVALSGLFVILFFPLTQVFLGIRGQRPMTIAALAAAAVLLAVGLAGLAFNEVRMGNGGYHVPVFGPVSYLLGGVAYVFWIAGIVNLLRALRSEASPFQRNRIRYVLLGALITVVGAASNFTPLRDYPVDIAANLVSALVIGYAVARYRLMDIRLVLVRSLFYSILTGLLVLLYLLAVVSLQGALAESLFASVPGQAVLAVVVLAVVFFPIRALLQYWIDRLFLRRRRDYQRVMERFSRAASTVQDPARLYDQIVEAVRDTVRVERLVIAVWRPHRGAWVVERTDGSSPPPTDLETMRTGHELARWLERRGQPLHRGEIGRRADTETLGDESRGVFDRTQTLVVVPLLSRGRLSASLHLGRKMSGAAFGDEDLSFLITMANQAATALENATVYRELERRLAEQTFLFILTETFRRRTGFETVMRSATEVLRDFLNLGYCLVAWVRSGSAVVSATGERAVEMGATVERIAVALLATRHGPRAEGTEILDLSEVARTAGVGGREDLTAAVGHDCVVVRRAGELLGLIVLPAPDERGSRRQDRRDLLLAVASTFSQALLLNRSITDLEETRGYNDSIINSMASSVIVVDRDMRITTANAAARRFAGLSPEEERSLVGRPLGSVEMLGQLAPMVEDSLRTGRTFQSRETLVSLRDRQIPVGISTSVLTIQGSSRGLVVIFTDLSGIKQLEMQLKRSEKLASIGRLAAGVSHELRNPLGSIAGYAELILERIQSEDDIVRRGLRTILSESERSRRIIESLLDYARVKTPRLDLVEVRRLVEDTVPLVERELAQHRIGLVLEHNDEDAWIRADREQMREVLINLILNALQATTGEGRAVIVRTRLEEGEVRISVVDQGCGIPPENLSKLFDPFFTTKTDGTGLGLAIVHQIVEAHEGMIQVDSTPGRGAAFTISLRQAPG